MTFTYLLVATLSSSAIPANYSATLDSNSQNSALSLKDTYRDIIENHLRKNFSIMRTVRILINNYPEHASYIVNAAFDVRENRVTAIVVAAMQAEPAVTYNVVDIAITRYPELSDSIIEAAIQTEPAYINDIIKIALRHQPNKAETIIRKVVASHPDFTESVLRLASQEAPSSILSSITESIKALPETATSLIAVMKDFFVGSDNKDSAYDISKEDWRVLTLEARQSGVSREELEWLVKEGYLEEETLAKIFSDDLSN